MSLFGIGFLIFRAGKSINYNKNAKNPILTLEVENYGDVKIELEPDYAPNTVATIIKLAQNGFYDGKVFYGTDSKVVACGMEVKEEETTNEASTEVTEGENTESEGTVTKKVQEDKLRVSDFDKSVEPYVSTDESGYSSEDEAKDYKVSISGEFVANGFNDNTMRFEKGTVGLFRNIYSGENLTKESYNSGTSLFFITTTEDSSLNGEYAGFGKVIEGMDIIEDMLTLPVEVKDTDSSSSENVAGTLTDNQEITKYSIESVPVITKATVETFGIDYGTPKYEKAFDYDKYMSDLILQYYRNQ